MPDTSLDGSPAAPPPDAERRESISWLELFFDLVVVAAVSVITEGLRGDLSWPGVGATVVLFTAIWLCWLSGVLYANVAAEQTRTRPLMLTMLFIAAMAASAPTHFVERANIFAVAFVAARIVLANGSRRGGRVLTSVPMLQFGGLSIFWIGSLWVAAPAKFWLWALLLAIDVVLSTRDTSDSSKETMERVEEQLAQGRRRHRDSQRQLPTFVGVAIDREHLDERLGLLIIIVLGESFLQSVHVAATSAWVGGFAWAALAAFTLLLGLWRNTFAHGFTGAPHASFADLPPSLGLPAHLFAALSLVGIAAGLAELLHGIASHPGPTHSEPVVAWLLGGGLALHFAISLFSGLAGRVGIRWVLGSAGVCLLLALALAGFGAHLPPVALAWAACVPTLWQQLSARFARVRQERSRLGAATGEHPGGARRGRDA